MIASIRQGWSRALFVACACVVAGSASAYPEGRYRWPLDDDERNLLNHFDHDRRGGYSSDPDCGLATYDQHTGIDVLTDRYNNVYAADAGTVNYREWGYGEGYWGNTEGAGGYGNHLVLDHGDHRTIYAHLINGDRFPAHDASVSCGELIGETGNSGWSSDPHLHFETRVNTAGDPSTHGAYANADGPFSGTCGGPLSYWVQQNGNAPSTQCAGEEPSLPGYTIDNVTLTYYTIAEEASQTGGFTGDTSRYCDYNGVSGCYYHEFMCSGIGVVMQGTGETLAGGYVTYYSGGGPWINGYQWLDNCHSQTTFLPTDVPTGASGREVIADWSIAVDKNVIALDSYVWIDSEGHWFRADDTGGAINGNHIDVFRGTTGLTNNAASSRVFVTREFRNHGDPSPYDAPSRKENWEACSADDQCQSSRCGCNGGQQPEPVCLPSPDYPKDCPSDPAENWSACAVDDDCLSGWCGCNGGSDLVCLPTTDYPKDCTNDFPTACGCPDAPADNMCHLAPGTADCDMTLPGGYCDPDGDGSYADGNWGRGWVDFQTVCNGLSDGGCGGLPDGTYCDGDAVIQCTLGLEISRSACSNGCTAGTCDDTCAGQLDGYWCDGDDLVLCLDDAVATRSTCDEGCLSMPLGTDDRCASFCETHSNGEWCDGDDLVYCSNGETSWRVPCTNGCQSNPPGYPDNCY